MKTIIAGSREITDYSLIAEAVSRINWDISEVVSGCAKGVDSMGALWARKNGIPVKEFPADWDRHGKSAGIIRNTQMAKYADGLVAIWSNKSRGTGHMISEAKALGLQVSVFLVEELKKNNPIKNNPVFGDIINDNRSHESLTLTIDGTHLTYFQDKGRNPPLVNCVIALSKEIDKLREEVDKLKG